MWLQAPPPPAAERQVVVNPDWLVKPNTEQMRAAWPSEAARRGVGGRGVIRCRVSVAGALAGCTVVEESPPGMGFGYAALLLAPNLQFKPKTVNGVPVPGDVVVPINFNASMMRAGYDGPKVKILPWAPWSRTPSAEEVRTAYPPPALARGTAGVAAFRCELTLTGALRDCLLTQETPAGQGFQAAGRKLLRAFKADLGPASPAQVAELRVVVVTRFGPHAADPAAGYDLAEADWLLGADPVAALAAYPAAARAAGVREGRALLECRIAEGGGVEACRARSEVPAGLGFGAAAATVAAGMRVNGWTRDGERAAGARVLLPIRLKAEAEPVAPAAPGG